jgi:hypothetical protein
MQISFNFERRLSTWQARNSRIPLMTEAERAPCLSRPASGSHVPEAGAGAVSEISQDWKMLKDFRFPISNFQFPIANFETKYLVASSFSQSEIGNLEIVKSMNQKIGRSMGVERPVLAKSSGEEGKTFT